MCELFQKKELAYFQLHLRFFHKPGWARTLQNLCPSWSLPCTSWHPGEKLCIFSFLWTLILAFSKRSPPSKSC